MHITNENTIFRGLVLFVVLLCLQSCLHKWKGPLYVYLCVSARDALMGYVCYIVADCIEVDYVMFSFGPRSHQQR